MQQQENDANGVGRKDFNYYITKFFLENSRLTILALILLLLLGTGSALLLKTTGFPDPEIKIAIVNTIYPGASSETISKDVTEPLEGAIKDVTGVKNYVSSSSNSLSRISVTIEQNANADTVRNKIDSAVKSVSLPTGVETPKLITPQIGSPDFYFSIVGNDKARVFEVYDRLDKDLSQLPETSSIDPISEIKRRVLIITDKDKLKSLDITLDQIQTQLKSIGESLPVVSNATIDDQSKTVTTKLNVENLEDIKNFRINILPKGSQDYKSYRLEDIAEVKTDYYFEDRIGSQVAISTSNGRIVLPGAVVTVRAAKGSDKAAYAKKIEEKFKNYTDISFYRAKDSANQTENLKDVTLIENFSSNDSSQEQVDEVIGGLIGSKLDSTNPIIANLGWFLGGIQLVFLAMLAFVSWRAALVAATAIPLSLVFSTIWLYFRGESLNTLVLFSLVLVIGLVVDPALVVLESIQRKIDTGLKGKEAVLAAVQDVGAGLFLASLTNIIVFLPFGVISGVLGQIFSYIPLTIIPATIGSYIVPLVFLAWIGGLFLKPTKTSSENEEENLWPIAKWLININTKILNSSVWLRIVILIVALLVPLGVAGYEFGSGRIKSVQFASSQNASQMQIVGSFLPSVPQADRQIITRQVLETTIKEIPILEIYPTTSGFSYFIQLKEVKDRPNTNTKELAKKIEADLTNKFGSFFFDLKVGVVSNGPAAGGYQVAIGVKTDDFDKLESAAKDVGKTLQNVCKVSNREFVINSNCPNDKKVVTKVDDGYTGKENKELDLILDRQKLYDENVVGQNGPASGLVNKQITELFRLAGDKKVGNIKINGDEVEIFIDKTDSDPKTAQELNNAKITTSDGKEIQYESVGIITEKAPRDTIQRVKGQTIGSVQARLSDGNTDQGTAALVTEAVLKYYKANDNAKIKELGLKTDSIEQYSEGSSADFIKSFQELLLALVLAIFASYLVLAVFFGSLTQPIVILFTIPLTFLGVFPALSSFTGGEFGFLEIIGFIILVGIVENVAIFLIDAARQKIEHEGWSDKRAIAFASGIRFRSVTLTKLTAIASLAPLAFLSEFYRSISIVIIFGLLTSGFTSLVTTPILFVFFRWLSRKFHQSGALHKVLFFPLFPFFIIYWGIKDGAIKFKFNFKAKK